MTSRIPVQYEPRNQLAARWRTATNDEWDVILALDTLFFDGGEELDMREVQHVIAELRVDAGGVDLDPSTRQADRAETHYTGDHSRCHSLPRLLPS